MRLRGNRSGARRLLAGLAGAVLIGLTSAACTAATPIASSAGAALSASASAPSSLAPSPTPTPPLPGSDTRPVLPLGTARDYNQPYQPCSPALLPAIPIGGATVSQAFEMDDLQAQQEPAAVGELVNYNWRGHEPFDAESLRVTVPPTRATLRTSPGVRLMVDGGGGACIAEWRVSARELEGFDGGQESGNAWLELGSGKGQGDAVVVGGLSAGEWMLHIHLMFGPDGSAERDSTDSYARVLAGSGSPRSIDVSAPVLVAACSDKPTARTTAPNMVLTTDGTVWTPGLLGVAHGSGNTVPDKMPSPVVAMAAGSLIRVRTADGSCGNDWSGAMFSPVPYDLAAAFGGAGLEYNDGSNPIAPTLQPLGGLNALAPAPGEWLFSVMFFFGDATVATYYWRISVR